MLGERVTAGTPAHVGAADVLDARLAVGTGDARAPSRYLYNSVPLVTGCVCLLQRGPEVVDVIARADVHLSPAGGVAGVLLGLVALPGLVADGAAGNVLVGHKVVADVQVAVEPDIAGGQA